METGCSSHTKPIGIHLEQYKRILGKVVPTLEGAHNRFRAYENLSIVFDEDTLVSYISKTCVPEKVEITNREYWQPMNVSGYCDDNIIIVTDKNESGQIKPYKLKDVIKTIPQVARKVGCILSFFNLEGGSHWELWQYDNVNTYEWEDTKQWKNISNVYNKFIGWFSTEDELYALKIAPTLEKYALVGNTLKEAKIYKGVEKGWMKQDINVYQKFLNDAVELIHEEELTLTDEQKEILTAFMGYISNDGLSSGNNASWEEGRPYTRFQIITDLQTESTLTLKYPKSIYIDGSSEDEENSSIHSITIPAVDLSKLSLKFTTGTWNDVLNETGAYLTTNKESEGYLKIVFNEVPEDLQISIDDAIFKPFTNNYKIFCDGKDHKITLVKPNSVKLTLNSYDSASGNIKTKTMNVPYGQVITSPEISNSIYRGHTFVGWATNSSVIDDANNSFCVVGNSAVVPAYFDFSNPITANTVLYAWYNINAVFTWTDDEGTHTETKSVKYNGYITDTPDAGTFTGYSFVGWQIGTHIMGNEESIGPVVKPVTITGVYQENSPSYNYVVTNNSEIGSISVTVGGTTKSIVTSKTFTLKSSSAVLTINTDVPTGQVWTINGEKAISKNVNAGSISINIASA